MTALRLGRSPSSTRKTTSGVRKIGNCADRNCIGRRARRVELVLRSHPRAAAKGRGRKRVKDLRAHPGRDPEQPLRTDTQAHPASRRRQRRRHRHRHRQRASQANERNRGNGVVPRRPSRTLPVSRRRRKMRRVNPPEFHRSRSGPPRDPGRFTVLSGCRQAEARDGVTERTPRIGPEARHLDHMNASGAATDRHRGANQRRRIARLSRLRHRVVGSVEHVPADLSRGPDLLPRSQMARSRQTTPSTRGL
jgi:hypothetical protein